MSEFLWFFKVVVIATAIGVLAYIVPGMALRAINDFFKRGKEKGEADGEQDT